MGGNERMTETAPTTAEIQKALYGRRKGARIQVCPPGDRTADGIVFHSKREMNVYLQFSSLLKAGTIMSLELQIPYEIRVTTPHGCQVTIAKWIADFVVTEHSGRQSIYDAKGHRTEMYRLKKKAVEAQYGIRILEV